jgi:hypothetical protein
VASHFINRSVQFAKDPLMLANTNLRILSPSSSKGDDDSVAFTRQQILQIARILDSTFEQDELAKARTAWAKYQSSRKRDAIYGYLNAVFEIVGRWKDQHCVKASLRQALRTIMYGDAIRTDEPFAVVIYCTSDSSKLDAKTRSKWSKALRCAERFKPNNQGLDQFIKARGGINECAAQWSAKVASRPAKNRPVA